MLATICRSFSVVVPNRLIERLPVKYIWALLLPLYYLYIYTSTWCQRLVAWNLIAMSFSKREVKKMQAANFRIQPQSEMLRQNALSTKISAKARHKGCP